MKENLSAMINEMKRQLSDLKMYQCIDLISDKLGWPEGGAARPTRVSGSRFEALSGPSGFQGWAILGMSIQLNRQETH